MHGPRVAGNQHACGRHGLKRVRPAEASRPILKGRSVKPRQQALTELRFGRTSDQLHAVSSSEEPRYDFSPLALPKGFAGMGSPECQHRFSAA